MGDPVMQARDRVAACMDEQPRYHGVDEARQRSSQQRDPESEGVPLMLEVGLSHRSRMVEEQAGEHGAPMLLAPLDEKIVKVASNIFSI